MPTSHLRRAARRFRGQACPHDHAARPDPPRHRLGPGWRGRGEAGGEDRRADQPRYAAATRQAGEAATAGTPRFVGIDDWAWCKGQRYGTIVVDLETSDVIDLLPDRDAATVKAWLEAHPGVELVSRDRASAYSQAATEARPRPSRSPIDGTS